MGSATKAGFESRAVKGSPAAGRNGERLGLDPATPPTALIGRPLRMGVMSGIVSFSADGGAWTAPIAGGEAMSRSGEGKC